MPVAATGVPAPAGPPAPPADRAVDAAFVDAIAGSEDSPTASHARRSGIRPLPSARKSRSFHLSGRSRSPRTKSAPPPASTNDRSSGSTRSASISRTFTKITARYSANSGFARDRDARPPDQRGQKARHDERDPARPGRSGCAPGRADRGRGARRQTRRAVGLRAYALGSGQAGRLPRRARKP